MATKKQFVNGGPAPVTPKSNDEKAQDHTPGQNISSEDQDYDENEHGEDIAAINKEKDPKVGDKSRKADS